MVRPTMSNNMMKKIKASDSLVFNPALSVLPCCTSNRVAPEQNGLCDFESHPITAWLESGLSLLLRHAFASRFAAVLAQAVQFQQMPFDVYLEFSFQRRN